MNRSDRARAQLDQRADALARKHHRRLQKMTLAALDSRREPRRSPWRSPAFGVAVATAFTITLAITALLLRLGDDGGAAGMTATTAPAPDWLSRLPGWVRDTDAPLDLLENYDFYSWLARQKQPPRPNRTSLLEGPHDPVEPITVLAYAAVDKPRHRQRRAPADLATRLPRTTAAAGAAQ